MNKIMEWIGYAVICVVEGGIIVMVIGLTLLFLKLVWSEFR